MVFLQALQHASPRLRHNMAAWNAPNPNPDALAGPNLPCDDRVAHGGYINPCSNAVNMEVPLRLEFVGNPILPVLFGHTFCSNLVPAAPPHHPHNVCRYCVDYARTQPYYRTAHRNVFDPPPAIDHKKRRGFLVRMCAQCEQREQLVSRRWLTAPGAPGGYAGLLPLLPPPNAAQMANFPHDTCTCKDKLQGFLDPKLCRTHLRLMWDRVRRNLASNVRNNRNFLEDITLNPVTGLTHRALPATKRLRTVYDHARRPPRVVEMSLSCRCGAVPVPAGTEQVLQCLGCESHVHLVPLAALPPPPVPPPVWMRRNRYLNPGQFATTRATHPSRI